MFKWCSVGRPTTTTYETNGPYPCCTYRRRRRACRCENVGQRDVGPSARDGRPGAYTKRPSVARVAPRDGRSPVDDERMRPALIASLAPSVAERRTPSVRKRWPPRGHSYTTHNDYNTLSRVAMQPAIKIRFPVCDWPQRLCFIPIIYSNILIIKYYS